MAEASLHRNREELLPHFVDASEQAHPILRFDFAFEHRGTDEDSLAVLAERLHQSAIIEFTDYARHDATAIEPALQPPSQRRIMARHQHRHAGQIFREAAFAATSERRRREKAR